MVADDLSSGGEIFGVNIAKEYPLSEFNKAMKEFRKVATLGKVILNCQE